MDTLRAGLAIAMGEAEVRLSCDLPSERRVGDLQALYEVSQSLCSIRDLDRLLQFAVGRLSDLLEVEGSSIILADEEQETLYFKAVHHIQPGVSQKLQEIRFPAGKGIAGWVSREGVPTVVSEVDQDPRFYPGVDLETAAKTRSLLCVPLRTKERKLGVLEAVNKLHGAFSDADIRLAEAFANPLAIAIENARLIEELRAAREKLREENLYLRETVEPAVRFETVIGESPKMQEVYRLAEPVLDTTVTVLITGESGTGKELLARVIHAKGPRANGPFIVVNCSAIPETLLEAEFFGHEKGAFTGAARQKPGRFELASGGTLFLDEIGDMSAPLQAKLLRVLQEQKFERLGGTTTITTDARILAATNRDLQRLVTEGTFRRDLFYRLDVFPISLPPLRERNEDILPLARHFLKKYSRELRKAVTGWSKGAEDLLTAYGWPGNVRELENVVERAVILCRGRMVTADDLPVSLKKPEKVKDSSVQTIKLPHGGIAFSELERELILQALEQANFNKSSASRLLGLSRIQLLTRIKRHKIDARRTPSPRGG